MGKVAIAGVVVGMIAATAAAVDMTPLTAVVDESGFGVIPDPNFYTLSSSFMGGGFMGVLDTRVYVDDPVLVTAVTFVYDLRVTLAPDDEVEDMMIAATGLQNDLRIAEIIAATHGYVSGTTTKIPDNVDAYDKLFPQVDELIYEWLTGNRLETGDRSTMYYTTTGLVDLGLVSAAIQNGGVDVVNVLGPVDDLSTPDLGIPEPATILLLGAGAVAVLRRRRR